MRNLEEILKKNYTVWGSREYVYEKVDGVYKAVTYGDFLDNVRALALWLTKQGFSGKSVMIYGDNSIDLMTADLAVLHYVGISVCVSKEWNGAEILRAAKRLEISCILYGEEKREVIAAMQEKFPECKCICMSSFKEIFAKKRRERGTEVCEPHDAESCCKIVFSSGTTSVPKAVMLSEKNMLAGLDPLSRRCPLSEEDVDYLFLPLSHTYGGIYNFLYSLVFGFRLYLCSGVNNMAQELNEVNPTIFCGVPLIYKRFYEQFKDNISAAFGNRIKYLFCGGAYFDEKLRRVYKESSLNMMEAYALSETASTFSIQYPGDEETQSVGTVAEELNVKVLAPDERGVGEIAVKGDNVFLGYYGEPFLTAAAFTEDGYFRTGDLGFLRPDDQHGGFRLYLAGRIGRVLIGENGENVDPTHIEEFICERDENIVKALVYLEQGHLACELYLQGPTDRDWEGFFAEVNADLPAFEQIRSWNLAIDGGEERWKQ